MILVLTMAGRYQRFTEEGYKLPKYLLPWGERSVLATIIDELQRDRMFSDVVLIANHRDQLFIPHVHAIMRTHKIPAGNLLLTHDTKGQAATAFLVIDHLTKGARLSSPVVFHNIDTILRKRNIGEIANTLREADGFIDVFASHNPSYSYVIVDDNRRVVEIAEKIVVSELATSGLYGFRTAELFASHYDAEQHLYISDVYKHMLSLGSYISTGPKHYESDTIVLGTPVEYFNASLVSL